MSLGFNWEVFVVKSSHVFFEFMEARPLFEGGTRQKASLYTRTVTIILQSPKRTTGSA